MGKDTFRFQTKSLVTILKDEFVVIEKDKKPKIILPKMKICDLKGFKKEDTDKLKSNLPKKNPRIKELVNNGATLDVIYIHEPSSTDLYGHAVIRVDPKIREEIIKHERRIFMDTTSYHVKDQIHVTQCFTCQQFGHKRGSPYCSLGNTNKQTCLYCAGNHESRRCKVKYDSSKHRCANCIKTQKYRYNANHTSTSIQCPIHEKELDSMIRRTICDSKNFPIQRVTPSYMRRTS